MKLWVSALLSLSLSLPVGATTNEDPLKEALKDLSQKIVRVDASTPARLKTWGWNMMTYAVYAAGSIAILNPSVEAQVLAAVTRPPSDPARLAAIKNEMAARAMGEDLYHYYFSGAQRNMFALAGLVTTVGGFMWVAGYVAKWKTKHRAQKPGYYQSPETMQQFFQLDLDAQYEVASQDEGFKKFIFELHDAYKFIERGHPVFEVAP